MKKFSKNSPKKSLSNNSSSPYTHLPPFHPFEKGDFIALCSCHNISIPVYIPFAVTYNSTSHFIRTIISSCNYMLPAIELHNISKTFTERNWKTFLFRKPRQTLALQDVSLRVEKGEIMGLIGPNGAGKTTLIKILSTLVSPDSGEGSVSGLSLATQSMAIRNKIGMVSTNDRTFYWRLTGRENLDFFATLYNLYGPLKAERINRALQITGVEDKANSRFMSYSSGQKQRLAIARAMLSDPEVLLMDEATTSLDPIATRKLLTFTKETLARQEQKTIIWCTHNLHEAEDMCDRVTILHSGKVLYSGKLKNIADSGSPNIEIAFSNLVDFFQNLPPAATEIDTTKDKST